MTKRRVTRVREETAAYAAEPTGMVVMPWSTLDVGERFMETLRAKAKTVSEALRKAGIPHAVVGGLSVAAHVAAVNVSAARNTLDLDILLNRTDLERAGQALKPLGFVYRKVMGIAAFVPAVKTDRKSRFQDGVHIVFADERVRPEYVCPAPSLASNPVVLVPEGYLCLDIPRLLRMKLTSFRLKDQVHIQDMLGTGLITSAVRKTLPVELLPRLKQIEETTERERLG